MLKFFGNLLSGKNPPFYQRFTEHHHTIRDAIGRLPPPADQVQQRFIGTYRSYVDGTLEFSGWLVYGFDDRNPILTLEELRSIPPVQGYVLFAYMLVAIIRCSLIGDPKLGDHYTELVALTTHEKIRQSLFEFSRSFAGHDVPTSQRKFLDLIVECFPRVLADPVARLQASMFIGIVSTTLKDTTHKALYGTPMAS